MVDTHVKKEYGEKKPKKKIPRGETRLRNLNATEALIGRRGLTGMAMEGVVRDTGISKGDVSFHFPTKRHILFVTGDSFEEMLYNPPGRIAGRGPDCLSPLQATLLSFVSWNASSRG